MNDAKPSEKTLDAWLALTRSQGDRLADQGPVGLPVLSGSMLPDIPPGRTLLIVPADHRACRIGDVAVFTDGPFRLVAHRLLLRVGFGRRSYWFQKGDRNPLGNWIDGRRICGLALGLADDDGTDRPSSPAESVLYKPERVRQSLRAHLRNRLLAWPRRIRDRLTGAR